MEREHQDVAIDILIPKPQQVSGGKRRPGAFNARFSIIFSITLSGVTDERLLEAAFHEDPKVMKDPERKVRLEFKLNGCIAYRDTDGRIRWIFPKMFGNSTLGKANPSFRVLLSRILEDDQWMQVYCTHPTAEGAAPKPPPPAGFQRTRGRPRSASGVMARSKPEPCTK